MNGNPLDNSSFFAFNACGMPNTNTATGPADQNLFSYRFEVSSQNKTLKVGRLSHRHYVLIFCSMFRFLNGQLNANILCKGLRSLRMAEKIDELGHWNWQKLRPERNMLVDMTLTTVLPS